jgi:cell division transport system ATP-binding protein
LEIQKVINIVAADISQSGITLLKDINFELAEAEAAYLVGKSGSGKSSFLKALYGVAKIESGTAEVLNFDLINLNRKEIPDLRRNLGMIFQDFYLFKHWTVASNLSFVMVATDWRDKIKIRSRVEEVLEEVGLSSYFNTKVHTLSGGEQQRLAIARAIINKPRLIIADEPTGNLDPDTSDEILYLLSKVSTENKSAILLATHDYRLIDKFPARVFKCQNQKILEVE